MDEESFNQAQQQFFKTSKKQPEEEPLKSDEWICEKCNRKNMMTNDPNSCICINCKTKNQTIEFMI